MALQSLPLLLIEDAFHIMHPFSHYQSISRASRFPLYALLLVLGGRLSSVHELCVWPLCCMFFTSIQTSQTWNHQSTRLWLCSSHLKSTICAHWPTATFSSVLPTFVVIGKGQFLIYLGHSAYETSWHESLVSLNKIILLSTSIYSRNITVI